MARRQHLTASLLLAVLLFFSISYLFSGSTGHDVDRIPAREPHGESPAESKSEFKVDLGGMPAGLLDGESIAPKLENATLKAELGRATWKFMHTMVARFPEEPSPEERKTLETFIYLFGRLYPCGDCAKHFRALLSKYPPQTSSRNAAAGWLCFMHNLVNERLKKPIFDCNNIGDFYDCGCGDEDKATKKKKEEEEGGKAGEGDKKEGAKVEAELAKE
ncbi:erv2 [Trichoderma cornu-damae]|uniref:Sulfhydryl oxidase n=1 Tax=Trichoderma cornu-damae TaxID=654480 RepID=A0A9P8QKF9_9HYPO|nr:erv2 [Trichoderma cornu-damae]